MMIKDYESFKVVDCIDEIPIKKLDFDLYYAKCENVSFKLFENCLIITDIKDALKPGKTVNVYTVVALDNYYDKEFCNNFYTYLTEKNITLSELIKEVLKNELPEENYIIKVKQEKAVRVFTPFYKHNKINVPTKWTLPHIVKAIMSGQIIKGECTEYLTDDYAKDAANNFGKGEIDLLSLCKDLVEGPSGWRVYVNNDTNKLIELSVNCYYHNYNKVYFNNAA